jgi:hypothetical protein
MAYITSPPSCGKILDDHTANKLARICGMLGSAHAGEKAVAALKADNIVRDRGLTWHEVIALPKRTTSPETLSELCGWLLGHSEILSPWEVNFLREISGLKSISPKQRDCLDAITAKVQGCREAASW